MIDVSALSSCGEIREVIVRELLRHGSFPRLNKREAHPVILPMQKTHTHRLYAQQEMANAPTGPGVHQTKRLNTNIGDTRGKIAILLEAKRQLHVA
jgi:hypothetical protein